MRISTCGEEKFVRRPAPPRSSRRARTGSIFSIDPLPIVMPISRIVIVPPANRANSESWRPQRAPAIPRPNSATIRPVCPRDGHRVVRGIRRFRQDRGPRRPGTRRPGPRRRYKPRVGTRRPYRLLPWFLRGTLAMGCQNRIAENSPRRIEQRTHGPPRQHIPDHSPRWPGKAAGPGGSSGKLEEKSTAARFFPRPRWKTYRAAATFLQIPGIRPAGASDARRGRSPVTLLLAAYGIVHRLVLELGRPADVADAPALLLAADGDARW